MKQKPDVSCCCQVFIIKTGLNFGKPEYLSLFFLIFLFLSLFLLIIPSPFPFVTVETDINPYFYKCI